MDKGWEIVRDDLENNHAKVQLVLIFGVTDALKKKDIYKDLRQEFPKSKFIGCSTAGEICDTGLLNDSITVTAVYFEHSTIRTKAVFLDQYPKANMQEIATELVKALPLDDLVHLFVLSDGIEINGSDLIKGFRRILPRGLGVSGGLSGDYYRFAEAPVIADVMACTNTVTVLGLYGKYLKVRTSSRAGWEEFGAEKIITRSRGNTLYELDSQPALPLYEKFLGDSFKDVPASSIQYPLSLRRDGEADWVTRTIININREDGSLIFAGDVPFGSTARLMKTNTGLLIESAKKAAMDIVHASIYPNLAILISCFGRRGVLLNEASKEITVVKEILGALPCLTGFYSYGEIAPFKGSDSFELHNQTMTITAIYEGSPNEHSKPV